MKMAFFRQRIWSVVIAVALAAVSPVAIAERETVGQTASAGAQSAQMELDEGKQQVSIEASYNFKRIDPKISTSGVVGAERLAALKSQGYQALINLLPDANEYAVPDEAMIVKGQGIDYTYIPVEWSAPTPSDFEAFVHAMDRLQGQSLHVHCAANWRVSAFYALYAERKGIWTREQADAQMRSIWNPAEYPAWTALIEAIRG